MHRVNWALAATLISSGLAVSAAQDPSTAPPVVAVQIGIDPKTASEALAVDAEATMVEMARAGTSTTVTGDQIRATPVPNRSVWDVVLTTPGVLADRINVGGNHTGTDYSIVNMGMPVQGNQFIIDGVNIDNPSAPGVPGAYFDTNAIDEIQVNRAGLSAEYGTGGAVLGILSLRGMNDFNVSADFSHTAGDTPTTAPNTPTTAAPLNYNLVHANTFGGTFGGPIRREKGFFFAGYGRHSADFKFDEAGQLTDETLQQQYLYAKSNWSLAPGQRMVAFYYNQGRDLSGLPTLDREPDAVWQTEANTFQLGARYEYTGRTFGLSAQYSRFSHPVIQTPQGGMNTSAVRTPAGTFRNSYALFDSHRSQDQVKVTGVFSRQPNHTVTFGLNYRTTEANTNVRWANDQIIFQGATTSQTFTAYPSESWFMTQNNILSAFGEKRVTFDNVTLYGGVNLLSESGIVGPNRFLANPRNNLVTGATEAARDQWDDVKIQPRLGATWALGQDNKTRFTGTWGQYGTYGGAFTSGYQSIVETNGSDRGAIYLDLLNRPFVAGPQFGTPAFDIPDNEIDPDLSTPDTSELMVGVEHALLPEFVVGLNFIHRTTTNMYLERDLVIDNGVRRPATADDYVFDNRFSGTVPNGPAYSVDVFSHNLLPSTRLGSYLTNTDANMEYSGASVTFNKQLANRWMLRGNFTVNDWTWSDDVSPDPTPILGVGRAGDAVTVDSPDSAKQGVYINSAWQYDVSGLYQIKPDRPWGVTVTGHMFGRQGFPINPYFPVARGDGRSVNVQVTPSRDFRYDNVNVTDLGVRKPLNFGVGELTLKFDCYNCLNRDTELQRQNNIQEQQRVLETLSPRTLMFGARLTF